MTAEERRRWDRRDKYIGWLIVGTVFIGAVVVIYTVGGTLWDKVFGM